MKIYLDYSIESIESDVKLVGMHTRTRTIAENLSISVTEIGTLYSPDRSLNTEAIKNLENLGIPDAAIEQIKFFEMLSADLEQEYSKDGWIAWLLRKTKKSLNAIMKKKTPIKIVFKNADWNIYSETYTRSVLQLHKACKPYFDEFSSKDITLLIDLTGNEILIKE